VNITETALLIVMAFLPPILYAIWIRNTEKFNREKWKPIIFCFVWGATIAILASIFLELVLQMSLVPSIQDQNTLELVAVVLIAPFAEELTKPIALRLNIVKRELDELEDGLIYGAVAGLGFSATENLFYGYSFLQEGFFYFLLLIAIRSFGGCLLHASATAWTGYGYGRTIMTKTPFLKVIPYFLLAIGVHAFYNALLIFDLVGLGLGLFAALAFTFITITIVRKKIVELDSATR